MDEEDAWCHIFHHNSCQVKEFVLQKVEWLNSAEPLTTLVLPGGGTLISGASSVCLGECRLGQSLS